MIIYASMRADIAGYIVFNKETKWTGDLRDISGRRVLVLVHGVKNTEAQIRKAYTEIYNRSRGAYDAAIGIQWPGGATPAGWPLVSLTTVHRAAIRLAGIFEDIYHANPTSIDVDAHSLGCPIALQALQLSSARVESVWLMAPAMPRNLARYAHLLRPDTTITRIATVTRNINVFYSRKDLVLTGLYQVWPFRWPPFAPALGAYGEKTPDGNLAVNYDCTDAVGRDHTGYRRTSIVVQAQTNEYYARQDEHLARRLKQWRS